MQTNHPLVEALQTEAKNNPVFRDICLMFSQRQRTRGRLTVTRLKTAMEEEGFNYSRQQYEDIIKFMGKIGLGQVEFSKRGKAKSLSQVKIKLQSIGQAALQDGTLQKRTEAKRYETLQVTPPSAPAPTNKEIAGAQVKSFLEKKRASKPAVAKPKPEPKAPEQHAEPVCYLTTVRDGKIENIPLTAENIGTLLLKNLKDVEA